jgi:hypothetical protein
MRGRGKRKKICFERSVKRGEKFWRSQAQKIERL